MSGQRSRWLMLTLTVTLMLGAFGGVGQAQELDFWTIGLSPEVMPWLRDTAFPQFEQETGVKVIHTNLGWDDYWDKVSVAGAAGIGPDVLATDGDMGIWWGRAGWMLPLNSYLDRWTDASRIIPGTLLSDGETGFMYAVPFNLDVRGTAYNRRLYREAGLDPDAPPQSWEELRDHARRLTRIVGDELRQIGITHSWDEWWGATETFTYYLMQYEADLFDPTYERVTFHNEKAIETAEHVRSLYEIAHPAVNSSVIDDPWGGFYDGAVGIITGGAWVVSQAIATDPALADELGLFVGRYSPAYRPAAMSFVNGVGISKFADDPDLAWRFIEWLMSPEINPDFHAKAGSIGSRGDLLEEYLARQPQLAQWYAASNYVQLFPYVPPHVGDGLDWGALALGLNQIYTSQADARTKLTEIANAWQGVLDANWDIAKGNE